MKILHCCLSCFYIDGYGYQENILPIMNQRDGHEVRIVASPETYIHGRLGLVKPSDYETETGIPLARLGYHRALPASVGRKLRIFPRFKSVLDEYKPDIVLFHGACGFELLTLARYQAKNPDTKVYVDSHEDSHNSARSWLARNTLYRFFYRPIIRRTYKSFHKILYITEESKQFLMSAFGLAEENLEYYPLGGIIPGQEEYAENRKQKREELGLTEDHILCVHSGKLIARKKTDVALRGFMGAKGQNLRLIIIGSADEENAGIIAEAVAQDQRIRYLGWQKEEELKRYLCAADIYIQPGTQSSTMQNALCSSCGVMLFPYESHQRFVAGNGVFVKTAEDIAQSLDSLTVDSVRRMCAISRQLAEEYLDYQKLAKRIYR